MLFNSYVFLFLFLPATLLFFFLLGKGGLYRTAIGSVVLLSLFFYGWWDPRYLWLVAGSMLFNYGMGLRLSSLVERRKKSKPVLIFAVSVNLALLGYYKYAGFFIDNFNGISGSTFNVPAIVLPLGISFFTFTQIAFLVDSSRGKTKEYNILDYCLFVTFFPHLIAGPIVHHKDIIPQFEQKKLFSFRWENFSVGTTIFVIGLYKKMVMADGVAFYSNYAFEIASKTSEVGFYRAWGGALAYTLQIYFDFSGYSDMAIGLARMFGILFPLNFNSPYKATSIIEFWRRWHMTLSQFLRDYLYIPLGGNRCGSTRRYLNIFVTMLLGGIWHGAGWTFVIWGVLHGTFLMINHAWKDLNWFAPRDRGGIGGRIVPALFTFFLVVMAWVFFRAEDLSTGIVMLKGMFQFRDLSFTLVDIAGWWRQIVWTSALLAIIWLAPNTQEIMARFRPALDSHSRPVVRHRWDWRPTFGWAILLSITFLIAVMHLSQVTEFLYFQF